MVFSIIQVLGGIGLFVFGMEMMSRELQLTAGARLRVLLSRLTNRRLSGVGLGVLLGFLIHSGPATVMTVGFTNAGLLDFLQALTVIVGANIGTTLSMQVIAFNVNRYCYLLIFGGVAAYLFSRRSAVTHLGLVTVGLGLLFLGMRLIAEAVAPIQTAGWFSVVLQHTNAGTVSGMIAGVLLSAIFTAVIQSSGATIGILFALGSAGVFTSIDQVFPFVLGAHIGACAPALLGSIGVSISARRAAVSHLVFNVLGAAGAMALYRAYAVLMPLTAASLSRQVANTHTAVQVVTALAILPFLGSFAGLITRLLPSGEVEPEHSHLDDGLLDRPEMALVAALRELQRMAAIARRMFQDAMRGFLDLNPQRFVYVRKNEEVLDTLKEAINAYLLALAGRRLSRRQALMIQYLQAAAADLERIGDHVDSLASLTQEKIARDVWFTDDTVMDLIELFKKADHILALTIRSFEPSFYDVPAGLAAETLEARNQYVQCSLDIRQKERNRILEKRVDALAGMFLHRYIMCFNKIVKHSKTIALVEKDPLFYVKEHKLEKLAAPIEPQAKTPRVKAPYDEDIFHRN